MTTVTAASSSAATSSSGAGTAAINADTFGQNYQDFLTLLTAQLQNQDPTAPTDSAQFTNQLVLYSQVEQQININSNLNTLIQDQSYDKQLDATSMVGYNVTSDSGTFQYTQGTTDPITYTLPAQAAAVQVNIEDSSGVVVRSLTGMTAAGNNTVDWNGTDGSGNSQLSGQYSVNVVATDAKGNPIAATVQTGGVVTGTQLESDGSMDVLIGSVAVPLSSITGISLPSSSGSSSSSGS